jgi:hypothetical protein
MFSENPEEATMRKLMLGMLCLGLCLMAVHPVEAAETRSYGKSLELVWDEAVKAVRDAELVVVDSDRSEHWLTMATPKKTMSKSIRFEVELTRGEGETLVTVRSLDQPGSKKSLKAIAAYFEAMERRMR